METNSSETAPIITQTHEVEGGRIFEIVLNRPDVHNCVNGSAAAQLCEAWQRFRDDDLLDVAVLRGAGHEAFCSGADLSALEQLAATEATQQEIDQFVTHGTGPMGGTRIIQTKPVITVSQGHTYAGGLELFCHGHIRLAEPRARFSVACRRWGVPLVDGGTVLLPRMVGWAAALPLIITGQRIDAQRAHAIGLVWEVVAQGEGVQRAMNIARQLCQQPSDAMRADLASVVEGWHLSLEEALKREARNTYPVMRSESTQRGVEAFLQGRRYWFE
jgi:enoyl-CoA hydratase